MNALLGATRSIKTSPPSLALEHHGKSAELEAWLQANGYVIDSKDDRHLFALPASLH